MTKVAVITRVDLGGLGGVVLHKDEIEGDSVKVVWLDDHVRVEVGGEVDYRFAREYVVKVVPAE